jgi:ABC-type sugar transport system ATPase subunit
MEALTASDPAPPPVAEAGGPGATVLAVEGLAKAFGATQALRECSFTVRAGEVHAIVGENGSGKSTLVKILAGVHRPDAGALQLGGEHLTCFRSPRAALRRGVVPVFQEVLVVGPQTLAENIWLGSDSLFRAHVSEADKRELAGGVLEALLGAVPPLDTPVELLPLSIRQVCGIARALVRQPRILILDESTSALDVATRDRLFGVVRDHIAGAGSVIFISHRMDEIEAVADRITVLRSGRSVATVDRGDASAQALVRLMSGAEHLTEGAGSDVAAAERVRGEAVLAARGVRLRERAGVIDFALSSGELVGLAGLEGHGQDVFLRALWDGPSEGEVVRLEAGGETPIRSSAQAAALGIAYVPRDRRTESLFPSLSIRENFAAPTLAADGRVGVVRRSRTEARFARYRDQLAIKLASVGLPITTLSGGNQQKVVMARWLAMQPAVLLLNDPTRGVDLNAKRDLYALLRRLAEDGVSVVMLSTEVDELIELMDRVLVFREGTVFAGLERGDLSRETLVASFFGRRRHLDA